MLWLAYAAFAAYPLIALVSYILGRMSGKRRTVALFHELQDDGELIVMTRAQYEEGGGDKLDLREEPKDLEEVSYTRRDSEERRIDWAGSLKQSSQYGKE